MVIYDNLFPMYILVSFLSSYHYEYDTGAFKTYLIDHDDILLLLKPLNQHENYWKQTKEHIASQYPRFPPTQHLSRQKYLINLLRNSCAMPMHARTGILERKCNNTLSLSVLISHLTLSILLLALGYVICKMSLGRNWWRTKSHHRCGIINQIWFWL